MSGYQHGVKSYMSGLANYLTEADAIKRGHEYMANWAGHATGFSVHKEDNGTYSVAFLVGMPVQPGQAEFKGSLTHAGAQSA